MKTFSQWLEDYTKEHGTPPAHVMAEAAWNYILDSHESWVDPWRGVIIVSGDRDLGDSYGPHKQG